MKVRAVVGATVVCASLVLTAGPASAAVTESNVTVTSPLGTYLIDDQVQGTETITGTGTSDGGSSDAVDIDCYSGPTGVEVLARNVPVDTSGTFSFAGSLSDIAKETCVLRAVPHGDTTAIPPGSNSPYTGPTLAIGQRANTLIGAGLNAGDLESYDLEVPQLDGGFSYGSLGLCSIQGSFAYDPVTFASAQLDDCDAWFDAFNGETPAVPGVLTPTRSELQVDGIDAYLAGNAAELPVAPQNIPGYPTLTYGYTIDPATGDLALNETDQVVECNPGTAVYPPTMSSCSGFVPAGVQITMHISQTDGGRMATVTQYFSSTDGAQHHLDLLENNEFVHVNADGALDFPWTGAGMQPYTTLGQAIPGPGTAGPGSFFVKGDRTAADGSESAPQGSVTFSNPPDRVVVIAGTDNADGNFSWFDLHYSHTVPAAGSVALGFTYSTAFLAGEVASDAGAAEAAFQPSMAIVLPGVGTTTAQPQVVVSGTAGDANGLSSLVVNGQTVPVGSGGTWTAAVPLNQGANTITAIATNVFGNTAQAQTTVTYTPPVTPPPVVALLRQTHATWREPGRARKGKPPIGTTFSFTLDEAASIRLTFRQEQAGRRVNGRCTAPTRRSRHKPACRRIVTLGALSRTGHAGLNAISFNGSLGNGRKLAAGRYTVTVIAANTATGSSSSPERLTFTIVK